MERANDSLRVRLWRKNSPVDYFAGRPHRRESRHSDQKRLATLIFIYKNKGIRIWSEQTIVCVFAYGEKIVQWTILRVGHTGGNPVTPTKKD